MNDVDKKVDSLQAMQCGYSDYQSVSCCFDLAYYRRNFSDVTQFTGNRHFRHTRSPSIIFRILTGNLGFVQSKAPSLVHLQTKSALLPHQVALLMYLNDPLGHFLLWLFILHREELTSSYSYYQIHVVSFKSTFR